MKKRLSIWALEVHDAIRYAIINIIIRFVQKIVRILNRSNVTFLQTYYVLNLSVFILLKFNNRFWRIKVVLHVTMIS